MHGVPTTDGTTQRSGEPGGPAVQPRIAAVDQRTELSEFLRSRRARLRPQDVGLPEHGRRRVPGLRREELAQLAGVSVAYYIRLEQGRGRNVSAAVLEAIADALRLTPAERDHLGHLVRPVSRRGRPADRPQRVRPAVQELLDTMEHVPAFVVGRRLDIIGWNRLGCAVFGDFPAMPPERRNMAWQVFLDPATRELYVNWEGKACVLVALLRRQVGRRPDDPALAALIAELADRSEEFRRFWARHDVKDKGFGVKQLNHPLVGPLTLAYESLGVPDDPEQMLVTHHAAPGSPSAEALRALAAWPRHAAGRGA
ncbi:DNA-binding protein [Streptomyces albospinus]|uniref:DNA-binding protein n=1 Tax=Streptomyces albospinus TaxID=285515 RepID=A0ABQ2VPE5_9ACTN|nr:DNA-binding protein [Streptomyces albospinus]